MTPRHQQSDDGTWLDTLEDRSYRADVQALIQVAIQRGEVRVLPAEDGRVRIVPLGSSPIRMGH